MSLLPVPPWLNSSVIQKEIIGLMKLERVYFSKELPINEKERARFSKTDFTNHLTSIVAAGIWTYGLDFKSLFSRRHIAKFLYSTTGRVLKHNKLTGNYSLRQSNGKYKWEHWQNPSFTFWNILYDLTFLKMVCHLSKEEVEEFTDNVYSLEYIKILFEELDDRFCGEWNRDQYWDRYIRKLTVNPPRRLSAKRYMRR